MRYLLEQWIGIPGIYIYIYMSRDLFCFLFCFGRTDEAFSLQVEHRRTAGRLLAVEQKLAQVQQQMHRERGSHESLRSEYQRRELAADARHRRQLADISRCVCELLCLCINIFRNLVMCVCVSRRMFSTLERSRQVQAELAEYGNH